MNFKRIYTLSNKRRFMNNFHKTRTIDYDMYTYHMYVRWYKYMVGIPTLCMYIVYASDNKLNGCLIIKVLYMANWHSLLLLTYMYIVLLIKLFRTIRPSIIAWSFLLFYNWICVSSNNNQKDFNCNFISDSFLWYVFNL